MAIAAQDGATCFSFNKEADNSLTNEWISVPVTSFPKFNKYTSQKGGIFIEIEIAEKMSFRQWSIPAQ
jgi:hypothetical protein